MSTRYAALMTTQEIAARFMELCRQSKNFDAMEELYADNIVSVEAVAGPSGIETPGKKAVIAKSKSWAAAYEIHGGNIEGPFLAAEKFAVIFDFDVTEKATARRSKNREVAVYTVAEGKIAREEFLYGEGAEGLAR
jgi:hypothetical protein